MFLKRKRTSNIKARGCANGRPQREFISKDESSSPTVTTYALFISSAMEAMEGWQVLTCDIPGAFLQADWPEDNDCYLKFEGLMVKMICEIDPNCLKYVLINKRTDKQKLYGKYQGSVWDSPRGDIVLPEVGWSIVRVGIHTESLQPMHLQQDCQRTTTDHPISCG